MQHTGQRAMKPSEWKTYRTRFLVKAKQLSSALSFIDHLGRQHCGRRGDYLVESFDGVLSIAPRQIFEDIYVTMLADGEGGPPSISNAMSVEVRGHEAQRFEPLRIETLKVDKVKDTRFHPRLSDPRLNDSRLNDPRRAESDGPPRVRRKSPQPVRPTSSRMSLM
ncbi:MAG: hypothetical protein WCB05_17925 [Candidatus Sulfotelmatobacter sp.]|jgi:hypothetical protein